MSKANKHARQITLEKQRLDYIKNFDNQFQAESFKFMIEHKAKSKKKLVLGVIAITISLFLGYYSIIAEIIGNIL